MNLQFSLLLLGILVIGGIYAFSRWQERSRQTQKIRERAQSANRHAKSSIASAPTFERSEPGFGQTVDEAVHDSDFASLDTIEPRMGHEAKQDFVDADHGVSDWDRAPQDLRYQNDDNLQQPTGVATPIESSYEGEHLQTEVDDVPVLENIVYEGDASAAINSAGDFVADSTETFTEAATETFTETVAEEIDSDGYGAEDPEVLSDMVESPLGEQIGEQVNERASEQVEDLPEPQQEIDYRQEDQFNQQQSLETERLEPVLTEANSAAIEAGDSLNDASDNSSDDQPAHDPVVEAPAESSSLPPAPQMQQQSSFLDDGYPENESPVSPQMDADLEVEIDEDPEAEYAESRPSLKAFLGSIGPINKLKTNIKNQLDSVKAERERVHAGIPKPKEVKPEVVVETDFAVHSDIDVDPTIDTDSMSRDADELSASGYEFVIDDEEAASNNTFVEHSEFDESMATLAAPVGGSYQADAEPVEERSVARAPQVQTVANDSGIAPAEGFDKLSQIDYYVKLSGERDVSRDSVLAIYREGAAGIERTHSIYGLRLPEKVWRDVEQESEEARFGDLVVTIQLVDQVGSVTETDMTRFSSLIMKLSESTGRGFSFMAPIENAHMQAQAIERFKQRFDSIFVVNIRPLESEMFEGAIIERCAKQIGLIADENQFFTRYKPVGKQKVSLYSLANMSDTGEFDMENMRAVNTRGVTFFTRPAINRSPGAVFAEMVDAAKAFASRIKGEVIAPGYEDLSTEDAEAIRSSIEKVAAEMESHGINPGSEEANRLFG